MEAGVFADFGRMEEWKRAISVGDSILVFGRDIWGYEGRYALSNILPEKPDGEMQYNACALRIIVQL